MLRVLVAALSLCSFTTLQHAQSTSASLTGRITDPSQALVADARVAAVSDGTKLRHETLTNASGEYYVSNLPPGGYRLEVEKPGFKKLIKPDVILYIQDAQTIDLQMTVGAVSETVTVEGGAPLVNTESGTVSTVVDRTFVENFPLNGRSFQTLIALTPGVVLTVTAYNDQGQFSVNGQHADANYFTVDGVSANFGVTATALVQTAGGGLPALTAGGGTNSLVSLDAMQEFRIQTSSFAPEFGRTPGGQISTVTRSGTNAFHGTLFDYFRNDKLDARSWFVNYSGLAKPAERQNDFGGVFGGPVVKNKTFFFFSYEGLRLRQPATQQTVVPDASSRQQAPPGTQPFLNAYPIANGPELGAGLAQFSASFSNPSSLDAASIRMDHVINSKLTLFGRYNYSPSNSRQRGAPLASTVLLSMTEPLGSSVQTATAGITASITPGISNEMRANYSNQRIGTAFALDNFGGAVPLPDSALYPAGLTAANAAFTFNIPGAGQLAKGKQAIEEQRQVNFVDNFSVTRSGHQLKFGVDYRWLAPFESPFSYRQFIAFSGLTAVPGGALSGIAQTAATIGAEGDALLTRNFSLYGQDTWKVTPRFTLTYGLRWDVNPPLKGKNAENDPFTVTSLDPATIALAPRGTPLYATTHGNVAPRVGIAWQVGGRPNWGAVLRAGFGIFYDLGQGSLGGASNYFPYVATRILPGLTPFPLSPQNAMAPPITTTNLPGGTTLVVADPHLKLPRSYQWNVSLEQPIGGSQSVSVTYIGAIGRDLLRETQLALNPNFSSISYTSGTATSDYHAVQVKFERRLSRGLQALASYSFAHSIDSSSTDAFASRLNTPASLANPNIDRGDSNYDIRHSSTAGVTYDLPSVGQQRAVREILGGWSLDGFVLARSAPPVNVVGTLFTGAGISLYPRPNLNPGVPLELFGSGYPGGKIFNNAAFAAASAGQQGNFGRNVLRGFNAAQADLGVQRTFRVTEKTSLRFRGEFFNILNHPNFANPTNSLTSPLFGRSTQTLANGLGSGGASGGFNPLYQIGGPRSIQLALKLQF